MNSLLFWPTSPSEQSQRTVGLVLNFIDIFTREPPTSNPSIELYVQLPDLDRNDDPIVVVDPITLAGTITTSFFPTDLRAYRTLSGRITFPALDRRLQNPSGTVRRFRAVIKLPGLIPLPSDLEFDFDPNEILTTPKLIHCLPGPNYRFPLHVTVLRGTVVGVAKDQAILVRARQLPLPSADPDPWTDQGLTSFDYLGWASPPTTSTGRPLPFCVGLRGGGKPSSLEVVDATTGTVLVSSPLPAQPTDPITVQL